MLTIALLAIAVILCKSASNMDPDRHRRKALSGRRFLGNRWGHDWTPMSKLDADSQRTPSLSHRRLDHN
jgi:hypothetical protein